VGDTAPFVGGATILFDNGAIAAYTGVAAGGGETTMPAGSVSTATSILTVNSLAPFSAGGGWCEIAGNRLRYSGTTTSPSNRLTGIPTGGVVGGYQIPFTSDGTYVVRALPAITGVSGLTVASVPAGIGLRVLVGTIDSVEQAYWAAQFGFGEGLIFELVDKPDLIGTDAQQLADAVLLVRKLPAMTIRFETRNKSVRAGRSILVRNARLGIDATLRIQTCTLDDFAHAGTTGIPRRTVEAASQYLRFEQYLRALKNL
jgi:hypothetical protein